MLYENLDVSTQNGVTTVTLSVTFPTGGWSDPALTVVEYVTPPQDGIQEVALAASRPTGIVTQAFEKWPLPVSVQFETPIWFQGVRILGAEGGGSATI